MLLVGWETQRHSFGQGEVCLTCRRGACEIVGNYLETLGMVVEAGEPRTTSDSPTLPSAMI